MVPSQLGAVTRAKAQTQANNEAVSRKVRGHGLGPSVYLGLSDPGAHHGRDAGGRFVDPAFGSHGRTEHTVDRGQVTKPSGQRSAE